MTTNINADNGVSSGIPGLKTSADNSGVLALQTNGTTALTINASQAVGFGSTPTYGTSGQVLTSGGSSASPTWSTVAVTPAAVSDQTNTSTGAFGLPSGTTAQRPSSPANGYMRYNTTTSSIEAYIGGNWIVVKQSAYLIEYIVVSGGGAGGGAASLNTNGGGGGGGGLLSSNTTVIPL